LFVAMAVIWGIPYLLIKEAVDSMSPATVVVGRTLGGAVLLLPIAAATGALRHALAVWRWVLLFGAIEMAGPFLLLAHAERTLPSGLTGVLVSTVPLIGTLVAFRRGDRSVMSPRRVAGLVLGSAGVALVVGGGHDGAVTLVAVGEVLLVAVCYAVAPFVVATRLDGVPALGSVSVALLAVGTAMSPLAAATWEGAPTRASVNAVVVLAVVCTALAFLLFFQLIRLAGPVRATLFTYVNPVVAVLLGSLVLDERITPVIALGIPVVLIGCWLASARPARAADPVIPPLPADATPAQIGS
jgi:drug/metabolite transporter (DMT)-like permease